MKHLTKHLTPTLLFCLLLPCLLLPCPLLAQAAPTSISAPTINSAPAPVPLYTIHTKLYGFPGRNDGVYSLPSTTYNSDGSDTISYQFVNTGPPKAATVTTLAVPQTGSIRVTWHGATSIQPFALPPLSVVTDDSVIAAISLRYDRTIEVVPKSLGQGETLSPRDATGIEILTFTPGKIQSGTTSRAYSFRITFPAPTAPTVK